MTSTGPNKSETESQAMVLKKRHEYDAWRNRNTLAESLFIWRFILRGDEFPNLMIHRIQPSRVDALASSVHSVWHSGYRDGEELLILDIFECPSRETAHEFVLRLLGEFQSPSVSRQDQLEIGDIAFAMPAGSSILFARANLVVSMSVTEAKKTDIARLAKNFDRYLAARPESRSGVVPEIHRFEAQGIQTGREVIPLRLEAVDPLGRPLWYKLFSAAGSVAVEEGSLVYRPERPGQHRIEVCAINSNRGVAYAELTLQIEEL